MALRVVNLGSGSSGNALLVEFDSERILVDAGIGARQLASGLRAAGVALEQISAVLVSHEHVDHVRAIEPVRRAGANLFCTPGTARGSGLADDQYVPISAAEAFAVGSATVAPIAVSHDAAEPCGFHIVTPGGSVTVVTDTGEAAEAFLTPMCASDLIVVEANHDERMLREGPYPAHLKRRVASKVGHLSNGACGELLKAVLKGAERPPAIWLAHLSETNNRPALAVQTVQQALGRSARGLTIAAMLRRGGQQTWTPEENQRPVQLRLF